MISYEQILSIHLFNLVPLSKTIFWKTSKLNDSYQLKLASNSPQFQYYFYILHVLSFLITYEIFELWNMHDCPLMFPLQTLINLWKITMANYYFLPRKHDFRQEFSAYQEYYRRLSYVQPTIRVCKYHILYVFSYFHSIQNPQILISFVIIPFQAYKLTSYSGCISLNQTLYSHYQRSQPWPSFRSCLDWQCSSLFPFKP